MSRKTKIFIGFTLICIILSLSISLFIVNGNIPGRSLTIGSVTNNSFSTMKASYKYFNGYKTHDIDLKKDEELTINYKSEVKAGSLSITILDTSGEIIKSIAVNTSGVEKIKAISNVKYRISVEGNKTRGNYDISWDK